MSLKTGDRLILLLGIAWIVLVTILILEEALA